MITDEISDVYVAKAVELSDEVYVQVLNTV